MNACFRANESDVTYESFDSEVLVINLRNGNYYSLRGSALPIWLLAVRGLGIDTIGRALARSCQIGEAAAVAAVHKFTAELETEALLVRLETPPANPPTQPAVTMPVTFTPPVFDRYTDMQQLLLMDPIHEVDPTGWPTKAPAKDGH